MREIPICPICRSQTFLPFRNCEDFTTTHEKFTLVKCSACHFTITNPSPQLDHLPRYYKSEKYISHTSKAATLIDAIYLLVRTFTLKSKLRLVNKYTGDDESKTLLDYGCGTGEFLTLCKSNGWIVTGVEPSQDARSAAEANTQQSIFPTIQDTPNQTFNVITLWHVLEHIPDVNEALSILSNKLSDNGKLIVALPNHMSWDANHYKDYWAAYDVPRHLWHFSQTNIETLLKNHGLTIQTKLPMLFDAYYVSLLSEKYLHYNKTTITGMLKASLSGLKSNHYAKTSTEFSSIIYIATK